MGAPDPEIAHVTVDGEAAEADLYPGGQQGAILIHGLASERREMGTLPPALAEAGFTVLAIDLRGHGASQGARGVLSRARVLEDLTAWTDRLAEADAVLSLLAGHSLGGLWALYAAPRLDPDAVAVIGSPASIRSELGRLEEIGYKLAGRIDALVRRVGGPMLRVPYRIGPKDTLDDPDAIERARELDLLQRSIPLVNLDEFLAIDGPAWASTVHAPTLVAYASNDAVVPTESTRQLYEALPGERDWIELPGPHAMFFDRQAETCAARVTDWATRALS